MIPLGDASRRPLNIPINTTLIIAATSFVFLLELAGGDESINRRSLVSASTMAGQDTITVLTAMFMHTNWATSSSSGSLNVKSKL